MITWEILPFLVMIAVAAGLVQGLSGFGSALVMVPMMIHLLPPRVVVPMALVFGTVLNGYLMIKEREHLQMKRIWPLLIAGIAGLPAGALLLLFVEASVLKVMIGSVIILTGILILLGITIKVRKEKPAMIPVGIISGILNGSISMSGPPVILFFSNQRMRKGNFRGNIVSYFLILNIFTIPVFAAGGLFTSTVLIYSALLIVPLILGLLIGTGAARRIGEGGYRKLVLILVTVTGVSSLVSGLTDLF
ncbi:MAG: sulfite exporter TauE/SafE family protein [Thermoplasmatota archaeon]